MKVKDFIEILLQFDLDKEIVIAEDSMRTEIRNRDITEENGKVKIQV
jgi:hypothetical protein